MSNDASNGAPAQPTSTTPSVHSEPDIQVRDDPKRSAYVLTVDGAEAGHLSYTVTSHGPDSSTIDLHHTEVSNAYAGQGLGGRLVRAALDDIAKNSTHRVVVTCPYAHAWTGRHADEYRDLLAR